VEETDHLMGLAVRRPRLYLRVKKWIFSQSEFLEGTFVLQNRAKGDM